MHRYGQRVKIEREHLLGEAPPRADYLILKEEDGLRMDKEIYRIFRRHNIIEYKNPHDSLNERVLRKICGYANFYIGTAGHEGEIPADSVTVSVFRAVKNAALFAGMQACGMLETDRTAGIYHVKGLTDLPFQIVITGEQTAVDAAGAALKEAGAKRIVPLNVSGPFHSPMLARAGEQLLEALNDVTISETFLPYVANVTADYVTEASDVKPLLAKQVASSVRWEQTIRRLIADGADTFVEIGPGKTLTGFMRKISRDVTVCNIDKMEDFLRYVEK